MVRGGDEGIRTILLMGLNHTTADVETRECLAFPGDETRRTVAALRALPAVDEAVLISTCNRVELLVTTSMPEEAISEIRVFWGKLRGVAEVTFDDALYVHRGDAAVRHVFRVAAGLDSMVMGEPQILGQIKAAYGVAFAENCTGTILNRLLHKAFFTAKKVRTETGIGDHAVSISYAAVELGRKIFGGLAGKRVLLIGAGEMAELAMEHLMRHRVGDVLVANRTLERGFQLAKKFSGEAISFEEIPQALAQVDIVISSTGAPGFVILPGHVKAVMRRRRNRALFFIDIAVPRDIDPAVNRMSNVYVYGIDDLKDVVTENREDRKKEAVKGERIVDEAVFLFQKWLGELEVIPTLVSFRRKIEAILDDEICKTFPSLGLSEEKKPAVLRMKAAMLSKILHHPALFLKTGGEGHDKDRNLDLVRKLFHLDDPEGE